MHEPTNARLQLTEDRRAAFLAALSEHGIFTAAARAASPGASGSCAVTFRDAMRGDPAFAEQVEQARERARDEVRCIIRDRAISGAPTEVVRGGEVISIRTPPSDRILELWARMVLPEARDRGPDVNVGVGVQVNSGSDEQMRADLSRLSPDERHELRRLFARASGIGERAPDPAPHPGYPPTWEPPPTIAQDDRAADGDTGPSPT